MKGVLVKEKVLLENETFELQKKEVGNGVFLSILINGTEVLDRKKIIIID